MVASRSLRALAAAALVASLATTLPAQFPPPPPPPPPPLTPLQPPPVPPGNPITTAKVNLGKALFWDEQMSSTQTTACGTCHLPEAGGSDLRSVIGDPRSLFPGPDGVTGTGDDVVGSPGVPRSEADGSYTAVSHFGVGPQVTPRKTPTMIDAGYAPELFWDGRASTTFRDPITNNIILPSGAALESQVLGPPLSNREMGHFGRTWVDVAARIGSVKPLALAASVPPALTAWINNRSYPQLFLEAFGDANVTPVRIAMAIATYERTLVSDQTPLDLHLAGTPTLTQQQMTGMQLFAQAGCATCHSGNRFTDDRFHDLGLRPAAEDQGRFDVTGNPADIGRFKTPGLRNVALRGPFMHNGELATLNDVMQFYNQGATFQNPNTDPSMVPLNLSGGQRQAIIAFLQGLTDPRVAAATGPFERPTLFSESANRPTLFGVGTAGSGGFVPRMVAVEPPLLGNPSFTVAMDRGLGGRLALLLVDLVPDPVGASVLGVNTHLGLSPNLMLLNAGVLKGVGAGAGYTSLSFDLNVNPNLVGVPVHAQWAVFDPSGPAGVLSASQAATAVLF